MAEITKVANPAPLPSHLPDEILKLGVKPAKKQLDAKDLQSLRDFYNAACYIAAATIFLRENVLLESPLDFKHVKTRLLGHWGTCPGLVLLWAHLSRLIRDHNCDMIHVVGPGHGAPAAVAALWLEGSLERFYPEDYPRNREGLHNLISRFALPNGFPTHINAETPGSIHEGGELGYALSTSFGAVMDKPDLVVACVVGDGEAETGPTAASWHGIKYIDPKESGAVIPILHANGFKISSRTIYGCMDDKELIALFSGFGYQVCIVQDVDNIDIEMASALEWALAEVRKIQNAARRDESIVKPRWPLIVMRTPQGWGGPKEVDGKTVEGSVLSHQVPLTKARSNKDHLEKLRQWLTSYKPEKLLPNGQPVESLLGILPKNNAKRLGQVKDSYDPEMPQLELPDWKPWTAKAGSEESSMVVTGKFLDSVLQKNASSVRIFCPDELESNKLGAVLEHSGRNFQWDQYTRARGGRVIETLSEHNCQGFMQGYTLTGRVGIFPSYESFLGIVHTMMVQYAKFNKIAKDFSWRKQLSSINYLVSSTWARQEHNGFSHQNPSFIGAVLNLKADAARVYLPPDANCMLSTVHHCITSRGYVNLLIGSKHPTPVYLSADEAAEHCRRGVGIWDFASTDGGKDPDVVLAGIGVEVTFEVIKAAELLAQIEPALRIRVVNVTDLMVLAPESNHPHSLSEAEFEDIFTAKQPVCFNYHGYAVELQGLVLGRRETHRMSVEGYREEGSTTTPFDMMLANHVSRFHLVERALKAVANTNETVKKNLDDRLGEVGRRIKVVKDHIQKTGADPDDTYDVPEFMKRF